jgi:LuxR family maltose regulon positive regulatory protein
MENESNPILKTKLYIPALRPDRVDRPRLWKFLDEALRLGQRLTLVSARAGAGKTTLVSDWLRRQTRHSAWFSLDAGDNDPRLFLGGLLEALRPLEIQINHRIWSELEAPRLPAPEILIAELINDLTPTSQPFILVLDDYHLIQNDWIHQAIRFLIEHQPPAMHLILITRVDPQLPLALLRGRSQLTEIRDQDLQFTVAEADQFLNGVMALDLPVEAVAAIEERTEGWIAGLQMAAISMQGRKQDGDLSAFIEAFSGTHRFILDYLIEEVLNRQSPEIQNFLLETSILDRMCGDLCDAIRSDAERRAEQPQESQDCRTDPRAASPRQPVVPGRGRAG